MCTSYIQTLTKRKSTQRGHFQDPATASLYLANFATFLALGNPEGKATPPFYNLS